MTACNERPPDGHPWHGSGVACHFTAGHRGPHAWSLEAAVGAGELLKTIDDVATFIVDQDLPDIPPWRRREVVGHLTGALFVRLREGGDTLLMIHFGEQLQQVGEDEP